MVISHSYVSLPEGGVGPNLRCRQIDPVTFRGTFAPLGRVSGPTPAVELRSRMDRRLTTGLK
jgi:hypothetical protein